MGEKCEKESRGKKRKAGWDSNPQLSCCNNLGACTCKMWRKGEKKRRRREARRRVSFGGAVHGADQPIETLPIAQLASGESCCGRAAAQVNFMDEGSDD